MVPHTSGSILGLKPRLPPAIPAKVQVAMMAYRSPVRLPSRRLDALIRRLHADGYRCVGPTLRDGAVTLGDIQGAADLPLGVHDRQAPGEYSLTLNTYSGRFGCATGPQGLKPLLFAPRETLWRVSRDAEGRLVFEPSVPSPPRLAVIGARACDLAALALQDRHFLYGRYRDPYYAARRRALFVVAINCSRSAGTCFCASTGDGPHCRDGYDLSLTELDDGYLARAGSEQGQELLAALDPEEATPEQIRAEVAQARRAAEQQSRRLPGRNLGATLFERLDHPRWEEVAERCLACGNCTQVCPTCFCHAQHDAPALDGEGAEHRREWDSCFTVGHAYLAGHQVRPDRRSRYRQWLTHKLGSWHEQYGRSGCVGCGRCITWCPVGIDITEEASALCAGPPMAGGEAGAADDDG